jgi:hypothetical protein
MFDVKINSLGVRNCVNEKTNEHGSNDPADTMKWFFTLSREVAKERIESRDLSALAPWREISGSELRRILK